MTTQSVSERESDIYTAVIRRYLSTSQENSFPDPFPIAFVLDQAYPDAADPMGAANTGPGRQIPKDQQQEIVAALADLTKVTFVASRDEVLINTNDCAQVRDGGILIVLAPPTDGANEVNVGVNGFVACLGATWLTYVVTRGASGWAVTGTTGSMAIA